MRSKLGIESYGIFWALLELLFNEENKLCIDDYSVLAFSLQCDADKLKSVIEDFDLFIIEDGCFYSKRLNDHIENINSKSLKAKESVNKRWEKIRTNNDSNTSRVYKSIEDNSKVDKSKVNKRVIEFKNSINQIEGVNNNDKDNFFLYWSELNKSGTKQKFELEKTWDLNRRLKRWSNSSFNKKENGIKFPDYYDIHFAKRIEQDQNATLLYHKHLESIGYIKELNTWNGSSKWIKK